MKTKKTIQWCLIVTLAAVSLFGCSKKVDNKDTASDNSVTATTAAEPTEGSAYGETYPLNTDKVVTYWSDTNNPWSGYTDYTQSPFHTKLSENIGADIKWQFPASGTDSATAYNLLMTSSDLPDIINYNFTDAQQLIEDGYIIRLNEYILQYAPNFAKYLEEHPDVDKAIRTDNGDIYMFPWVRNDSWLCTFRGIAVRQDWLDEQGLTQPETLADLDKIARIFKEKYNAYFSTVDYWLLDGGVSSAFDTWENYYIDTDNTIKFGPANEGWREYMKFMNSWYKDGILDPDWLTNDATIFKTKVLNNEVGVAYTSGNNVQSWIDAAEAAGSSAIWKGVLNPVQKAGDTAHFTQLDQLVTGQGAAITTSCKDIELAMKVLDYAYSEEGMMYYNFGTEGETYTINSDGNIEFTDLVTMDKDGISTGLDKYTGCQWAAAGIQDKRMYVAKNTQTVVECIDTWTSNTDHEKYLVPRLSPTSDESNELAPLVASLTSYVDEMMSKFIIGEKDINDDAVWQAYLDSLKDIGLDRVIEIKNAQYQRYLAR